LLSPKEITRYSRNILLSEVGRKGQEKLKSSTVSVIGAGGLGSPLLYYLVAAGIGTIKVIDSDIVDLTNLQRQILFKESSIGKSKSLEAKEALLSLNPNLDIQSYPLRLIDQNINEVINPSDLVIEGSDNFETKFLVNDYCYFNKIPLLIGGILRFEGQVLGIKPEGYCYRCIFHSIPDSSDIPNCSDAGVIGSIAGIIGSLLATESIKYLLNLDDSIFKNILSIDMSNLEFRKIPIKKNNNCPLCGKNPIIKNLESYSSKICEVE
jgi:adenylyltransferase/sulfurtransferase